MRSMSSVEADPGRLIPDAEELVRLIEGSVLARHARSPDGLRNILAGHRGTGAGFAFPSETT
jgi:hypothetical protein